MNNVLENSLFVSQNKKFDEIQSIVRQFSAEYVGNSVIKDNIFAVIQNYARKKEIALELLRYPIHDDELWALTFLKQDTIFVCVNTALPLCKQFFAAAHELYHIYCYVENADQSYIKNGSMLDSATGDETGKTQEDLEANAFAGLLLMPDQLLHEQILLYGLDKDLVSVDSALMLMDMFAMPYKAVVLRLFESGNISHQQAEKLLEVSSADVMKRVSLTGKAKRWQLDGKGTESFGTLLEKVEYNRQHLKELERLDIEVGKKNNLGEIKSFVLLQVLSVMLGEQIYVFCSDDKNARNGATNFEDVRCISLVSVFSRLKEESNWTLADAEPYIESLIAFYQKHHQTTFRVMEASEVRRLQRIPCRQVLQEIFDGKFIELKNGMLRYKQ